VRVLAGDRLTEVLGWAQARPDAAHPASSCVPLPLAAHRPSDLAGAGAPDGDARRYGVVELVASGTPRASVRVHFYDLGPARGFVVAGVERGQAE
jgi:hypothetical protein